MTSVYLHSNIIDTFMMFGEPKSKIVEALSMIADGYIDIPDNIKEYSVSANCKNVKRLEIDVPKDVIERLPFKIRPLIYWFIEEEMYSEIGWVIDPQQSKWLKSRIAKAINALRLVQKVVDYAEKDDINIMIEKLNSIGDKNGKTKSDICETETGDRVS